MSTSVLRAHQHSIGLEFLLGIFAVSAVWEFLAPRRLQSQQQPFRPLRGWRELLSSERSAVHEIVRGSNSGLGIEGYQVTHRREPEKREPQ